MSARTASPSQLSLDECWAYLEAEAFGRIAIRAGDGVDIFPINFVAHERRLYFRSAPGSKLMLLTEHPEVAFEIDGLDGVTRWSVVVHGTAHRLDDDREIEASGVLALTPWTDDGKYNFVRVAPATVTGRRFERSLAR